MKTMDIIGKRKIWYAISLLIIIPGLISLVTHGLRLGIDFTGGSLMEVQGTATQETVNQAVGSLGFKDITVTTTGANRTQIRYRDEGEPAKQEANHQTFKTNMQKAGYPEITFDAIGPSVSRDIARNALIAIIVASLAIVLYIALAFRNVPAPASPWRFGVAAIVALLHDVLLLLGVFSLLGVFLNVEVNALFVTAVLTVMGFSVHDTIVVFDRVRENLRRERKEFDEIVNDSILETFVRSLNTSLTVLLTLLALFLFGGQSIRLFVLALIIGIASGTYSSIFNATPLLVTWQHHITKKAIKAQTKPKPSTK
jgi:preprotein translocase subunit SecF